MPAPALLEDPFPVLLPGALLTTCLCSFGDERLVRVDAPSPGLADLLVSSS